MKTTIISLGGSLIVPEKVDVHFLKGFRELILGHEDRFVIICGGGSIAREYQKAAREIADITHTDADWVGIMSTKLNAELVRAIFADRAFEKVIEPEHRIETDKRIIIASGYHPGWSTDKGAVLLARHFGAKRVINMSNIDKVYDKDPKHNDDARPLDRIAWRDFLSMTGTDWVPGKNVPFDPVASRLAMETGIEVVVIGKDMVNLKRCLDGGGFTGTLIS
jgi:uridylate kinase